MPMGNEDPTQRDPSDPAQTDTMQDPTTVQTPASRGILMDFLSDQTEQEELPTDDTGKTDWSTFLTPLLGAGLGAMMGGGWGGAAVGAASALSGKYKGEAEYKKEWRSRAERHLREKRILRHQNIDALWRLHERALKAKDYNTAAEILSKLTGKDKEEYIKQYESIQKGKDIERIQRDVNFARQNGNIKEWGDGLLEHVKLTKGAITDGDRQNIQSIIANAEESRDRGAEVDKLRMDLLKDSKVLNDIKAKAARGEITNEFDRRSLAIATITKSAGFYKRGVSPTALAALGGDMKNATAAEQAQMLEVFRTTQRIGYDELKKAFDLAMKSVDDPEADPALKEIFTRKNEDGTRTRYKFSDLFHVDGSAKPDGDGDKTNLTPEEQEREDGVNELQKLMKQQMAQQGIQMNSEELRKKAEAEYDRLLKLQKGGDPEDIDTQSNMSIEDRKAGVIAENDGGVMVPEGGSRETTAGSSPREDTGSAANDFLGGSNEVTLNLMLKQIEQKGIDTPEVTNLVSQIRKASNDDNKRIELLIQLQQAIRKDDLEYQERLKNHG
jgi:hypothetical protein